MGLKKPQLLALAASLVVIVLLVLAPRVPAEKRAMAAMADPMKIRTAEAVALVQGEDPMRGIMMLRQILEDDPGNVEAHWQMGLFSVQSGQFDKALERFKKVVELAGDDVPDAWFYLGRTYATLDSIPQAVESLRRYRILAQETDTALVHGVDRFILELENEL